MSIQQEINSLFSNFPNHSKVWVYQSNKVFSDTEASEIQHKVRDFICTWAAHGKKVQADGVVLFNRFIVLVADESLVQVSGCSIDSSVKLIKQLQQDHQLDFFDRFYSVISINNEELVGLNKADLKIFFSENKSTINEVKVFNNTVNTLAALKNNWFIDIKDSWQSKFIYSQKQLNAVD